MDHPGSPTDAADDNRPAVEPLRLDVTPAYPDDVRHGAGGPGSQRAINWSRMGKIAAFVVAVAATTTFIVNNRHDSATEAAANETVDIVVAWDDTRSPDHEGSELLLDVQFFNAGPRDVELTSAHPKGWDGSLRSNTPQPLVAGEWTPVSMNLTPDCDGVLTTPDALVAEVVTQSGRQTVTVGMPPGDNETARWAYSRYCGSSDEDLWISIYHVDAHPPVDGSLPMDLHLGQDFMAPDQRITIVDITTDVPGLVVERDSFPQEVTLRRGASTEPIQIRWRVADCARAAGFEDLTIAIHWHVRASGTSGESEDVFPVRGAIALTRLVERQCA